MTQVILEANETGYEISAVLKTIKTAEIVNEKTILTLFAESKFNQYFIVNDNIKNLIAELNEELKPLQQGQEGREIRYVIAEKYDFDIVISLDPDEMAAYAELTNPYGGKFASPRDILEAAQEKGVLKGYIKDNLINLAQKAKELEPGATIKEQIAIGKMPIKGKDARLRHMVESAQNRILKPKEREDGTVDMRDLGDILCVTTGDILAQKVPPTKGHQGYTVTGTLLEPEEGEDFELTAGEGVKISETDSNYLVSEIVGMPKIIENGMMVDQVFQVKDVDVGSGHINFEGSVIIKGNVCEGMKVIASGDVTIAGFVESALVEAGGDITIQQGIIGRQFDPDTHAASDHKMSVTLSAGGNIFAKYAQYAEINCDHDVMIENQMMHCQNQIKKNLWVGKQDKANGKLIGGYTVAGGAVCAGVIGAPAGSNTIIKFYRKLDEIRDQLEDINERLTAEKEKTSELSKTIEQIKKLPPSEKTKEILPKAVKTYQHHAAIMADIISEQTACEERIEEYKNSVVVEATEKLHQGVEVHIGKFFERSRREYGPSRMLYKERKVIIDPIVNS